MDQVIEWFRDSAVATLVQALLAFAALFVSIYAIRKSNRTERRIVEIEEAREKDRLTQQKKAFLAAHILRNQNDYLVVENSGEAEAREISVKVDGMALSEHRNFLNNNQIINSCGSKSSFRYYMFIADQTTGPFEIEIRWIDASCEPGYYRTTLTI